MSYLSSCCISLHTRYVCVCCTLPPFIWKHFGSFPLAMPQYSVGLASTSLFEGLCPSSSLWYSHCWVYFRSFASPALASPKVVTQLTNQGADFTIHPVSRILLNRPLWLLDQERGDNPSHLPSLTLNGYMYFLVWGQVSSKGEGREMLHVWTTGVTAPCFTTQTYGGPYPSLLSVTARGLGLCHLSSTQALERFSGVWGVPREKAGTFSLSTDLSIPALQKL